VPRTTLRRVIVPVAALAMVGFGCEAEDEPISPDPDGLQEPADDPEGSPDDELGDPSMEEGTGEPAVEGDGEGRFDPEDDEDE
jgi:hypothetical protein